MLLSTDYNLLSKHLRLQDEVQLIRPENFFLTEEEEEKKKIYETNMEAYFTDFWEEAGTNNPIIPDISLSCVAEHLNALENNEFKTLLFVMPPRQGKSTLFSVMYPAYKWIRNPAARMLTVCYAKDYAYRDNFYMQELIKSQLYQKYWGKNFTLTTINQSRTRNNKSGSRVAASILGRLTGEGAETIVCDDVNNLADMYSKTKLENSNKIISRVVVTRQNMPSKTKFIIAQHRCSHIDAIGAWLSKNDRNCVYVNIPMEYEIKRRTVSVSPNVDRIIWKDPRTKEGELLAPERYDADSIAFLKTHMGAATYSALYQGNPVMDEASIFKEEWFRLWSYPFKPPIIEVIQSWDTAISVNSEAAFSACSTWGIFKDVHHQYNMILLSKWSGRKEWTELRQMMLRLGYNYMDVDEKEPAARNEKKPSVILVEAKANGGSLIQSLARAGLDCTKYNPPRTAKHDRKVGDYEDAKAVRARLVAPIVESGRVWVKTASPSYEDAIPSARSFIKSCTIFPSSALDSRDMVDTFTMTIDWLQRQGKLHTMDEIIGRNMPEPKYNNNTIFHNGGKEWLNQ